MSRNKRKTSDFRCLKWQLPCTEKFSLGKLPLKSTSSKKDIFIMPRPVRHLWKLNSIQKVIIKFESCLKSGNDKKRNDFLGEMQAWPRSRGWSSEMDWGHPGREGFQWKPLRGCFEGRRCPLQSDEHSFSRSDQHYKFLFSFIFLAKYLRSTLYEITICNEINPEFY